MAEGKNLVSAISNLLHLSEEQTKTLRSAANAAWDTVDDALVQTADVARRFQHASKEALTEMTSTFKREFHQE